VGVIPRSGAAEFATPVKPAAERKTCELATLLLLPSLFLDCSSHSAFAFSGRRVTLQIVPRGTIAKYHKVTG
jgi:hypothetical protein